MPTVAPKQPLRRSFRACLGRSVGTAADFWSLAHCPELDDVERATDPAHRAFTFLFRFERGQRTVVHCVRRRLDALWQDASGLVLAAGDTQGILEVDAQGVREVSLSPVRGVFTSLWGADDAHLFATGASDPFVLSRRQGQWSELPLPADTDDVRDVCGFAADDVYFVGVRGQVHHFDGARLVRLAVPVSRWLTGIARLDPDRMCLVGYQGTFLTGHRARWRHVVTNTTEPLLAVATLDGLAYYGVEDKVFSTDGTAPGAIAIDFDASWLSGLRDALVLSSYTEAKLWHQGALTDLDVQL